jgi:hypothetical protein
VTIPTALDEEASLIGVNTSSTIVVLPGEASTPTGAMRLANQRLGAQAGALRLSAQARRTAAGSERGRVRRSH